MTDQTPASEPVTFAPGKNVRLTRDWYGTPAGTEFMISGEVITDPWDEGKLSVVRNPGNPGASDYGRFRIPKDALEWADSPWPAAPPARERVEHDLQLACDTLNSIRTDGAPREVYLLTVALTALTRAVRTLAHECPQPEDRRDD